MSSLILFISRFIVSNFNEFLGKNGPYMSAAIAYYAFFALFPLSLALIAVFSLVLHIEGFEEQLIQGLRIQIPVLAEADDEFLGNFFAFLALCASAYIFRKLGFPGLRLLSIPSMPAAIIPACKRYGLVAPSISLNSNLPDPGTLIMCVLLLSEYVIVFGDHVAPESVTGALIRL